MEIRRNRVSNVTRERDAAKISRRLCARETGQEEQRVWVTFPSETRIKSLFRTYYNDSLRQLKGQYRKSYLLAARLIAVYTISAI